MKKILASGLVSLLATQPAMAIDLVEAYEQALAYDSGIAAAKASSEAQQAAINVSRSNLLPNLNAFGRASHTDTESNTTDDSYKAYQYGVELTQPLFRADAWFSFEASEFQSESARAEYNLAQQQLILDVASAYFNVLRAEDNLTTVRASETAIERQYEQAQERHEVGLIAITEVYEARATYDAIKSDRLRAENNLDIARERLARLVGQYTTELENLNQDFPLAPPEPASATAWEDIALQQNWRIQSAISSLKAERSRLDAAEAGHYPTLDLSASYTSTETDGVGVPASAVAQGAATGESDEGVIALSLNVPLYEGHGTQAQVRQQRSLVEVQDEQLNTVRRDVRVNARSLLREVNSNIETVQAQRQTIVSRRSALDATRAGYDVGTRNIVEVLDAERNYYIALRDYANARYDYVINTLGLKQAAGTLSPQDLADLNQWLSASAPGIEALAKEDKTVDPTQ